MDPYTTKKMEELKFEAPLAQFESEDFVDLCSDLQNLCDFKTTNYNNNDHSNSFANSNSMNSSSVSMFSSMSSVSSMGGGFPENANSNSFHQLSAAKGLEQLMKKALDEDNNDVVVVEGDGTFTDTFSGSLEDLVNTFDEKITKCFSNLDETTDKLAPVQMRSQEELMNDCQ